MCSLKSSYFGYVWHTDIKFDLNVQPFIYKKKKNLYSSGRPIHF